MKKLTEKIEVMQAMLEGKDIQAKYNMGEWRDVSDINWNWSDADYRIKPEPFECWVNIYNKKTKVYAHESKEEALKAISFPEVYIKTIKLREVVDDE